METTIIDFRNSLNQNTKRNSKNDFTKGKDFSSTLDSLNKKNDSNNSLQKNIKPNEDKKETISKNDVAFNESEEVDAESTNEEDEKDYSLIYRNMMYFFNNKIEVKDEPKSNEEIKLPILLEPSLENVPSYETSDISVEDTTVDLIIKEEINNIDTTKFDLNNIIGKIDDNIKEVKSNNTDNTGLKSDSKIPEYEVNKNNSEEILETKEIKENSLSYIEESDEKMEFNLKQNNNSNSSSFEEKLDTTELVKTDKNIGGKEEPFISMSKDSINFIKDNAIELDKPDTINRKEIIEQIVEKVKVDLSNTRNEIKVRLKPEVLGEMTMNIEVVKGAVTAKIMVDNQRTKEIIEGNILQLKEGIKDTGLEIKTVEVFVGNNSDFDKHSSGQFNLRQNNKKTKFKSQDNKAAIGYDEQSIEGIGSTNEVYSHNSLNLLA